MKENKQKIRIRMPVAMYDHYLEIIVFPRKHEYHGLNSDVLKEFTVENCFEGVVFRHELLMLDETH
jgi:hypothetical protein